MNYEFILNQDQDQADTTLILSFVCYLINNDIIIKGILFIYIFFFQNHLIGNHFPIAIKSFI